MRQWKQTLGVAAILILAGLYSFNQQNGRPRAGETVMPHLDGAMSWQAGAQAELGVRLCAKADDGKAARLLDFSALPLNLNPVANIVFYRDDQELSSLQVALSHRC
jgi:hypothetical protein